MNQSEAFLFFDKLWIFPTWRWQRKH